MQRLQIQHDTFYRYSAPVSLLPHQLFIRPRAGHDLRIDSSNLIVEPAPLIKWHRDIYGNSVGTLSFTGTTTTLSIRSEVNVQHFETMPLDFLVSPIALNFPFQFDPQERIDLIPYQMPCFPGDQSGLRSWCAQFWRPGQILETFVLLDRIGKKIAQDFNYTRREEPGVQRPSRTLALRSGSCRDFATLFIEAVRFFGLGARFVSGYLYDPLAPEGHGATHAWAEVYLPGAGWKGFDITSGQVTGASHIAVAVSRHPEDVPPIAGSFVAAGSVASEMQVRVNVTRG